MAPDDTLWEAPPHTLAKHAILRAYLQAWFPILASRNQRIIYYDGFAGPGRYLGGEEGSPLIALSVARDHRAHLDAEVRFSFVEERPDRANHLRSELGRTETPAHFAVKVIDGTFEDSLRRDLDDLERIGAAIAPTFAFIDPFGIKGLPFELIARLLRRDHCEVLITFMNVSIQRFVTELPEQVDSLIGRVGAAAEIAASEDRVLRARELYMTSLRTVARFVRFFELRDQKNVPIYDLFFASNHPLGHYRMKEAMWKVDDSGAYSFSDGIDPRQAVLFGPTPGRDYAPELWQRFRGSTVRSVKVLEHTRDHTAFLEKHAREALKLLEIDGVEGKRITVAPIKADGKPRRPRTYPDGSTITFSN
ncbi:MAG TPA: three-Cys-motif partner protein TcmP [Terrimesophilobacter sp.]|nr:three-Cys-motif partner protein TcmP [Terrimesophilobacter sp.]